MTRESLRFIHAANLLLDGPLYVAQELSDEQRTLVEDATFHAFDRVLTSCIDSEVDFLLLGGNSFIEQEHSLRARLVLGEGFRRLEKAGIPVFIIPGTADPDSAWRKFPRLPGNVTICSNPVAEPVAVMRNRQVIAMIGTGTQDPEADPNGISGTRASSTAADRPLSIITADVAAAAFETAQAQSDSSETTVPESDNDAIDSSESRPDAIERIVTTRVQENGADYVAVIGIEGELTIRHDQCVAHSPGRIQGSSRDDPGVHGCSLIEVDQSGSIRIRRIPTASVGWRAFALDISEFADEDDVVRDMVVECSAGGPGSERLMLIRWTFTGAASALGRFADDAAARELLITKFQSLRLAEKTVSAAHSFRFLPRFHADLDREPLAAEFLDLLHDELPVSESRLSELLAGPHGPNEIWRKRLETMAPKLDRGIIAATAQQMALHWFVDEESEGSAQ